VGADAWPGTAGSGARMVQAAADAGRMAGPGSGCRAGSRQRPGADIWPGGWRDRARMPGGQDRGRE